MTQPHRLANIRRGEPLQIFIDGQAVRAYRGETIATVLMAEGIRSFGITHKFGKSKGIYCGMGICHECLVTVNGIPNVRTCVTYVEADMRIKTKGHALDE